MQRDLWSRRGVLTITTACALASVGVATGDQGDAEVTRDSFVIREGTAEETTVYVTSAEADGPTAVVVGGVHGNEVAGYVTANGIADWAIDAGTLVTIPEANVPAIERSTRTDDDGVDLNRQFPEGGQPGTELAAAIWDVLLEYEPDVVVDLHESTGVYAGDPVDGVGQAIFRSDGGGAGAAASDAADYVTRNYVDDPDLAFQTGRFSGPNSDPRGLLVHKAARDLGADAFLAETLSTDVDLETRVQWHTAIVERLFAGDLLEGSGGEQPVDEPVDDAPDDADEPDEEPADSNEDDSGGEEDGGDGETPNARIRTVPENAEDLSFDPGQSVQLDGTCSCAPAGEIVDYEWDVGKDACFDQEGETITVTIGANARDEVVLRVVDDAGRTDTESITLSTD